MKIIIETIPHESQRYNTVGDWQFETLYKKVSGLYTPKRQLIIKVSETRNDLYNFLIGIHELIEAFLCYRSGITQEQVDQWDIDHSESNEPGEVKGCPYLIPHFLATHIEHMLSHELNIDWNYYEDILEGLMNKKRKEIK